MRHCFLPIESLMFLAPTTASGLHQPHITINSPILRMLGTLSIIETALIPRDRLSMTKCTSLVCQSVGACT
ncbi:hypothetical protein BKA67DRAFT_568428 [Truncatella angustata]|uniref:Secreted protein n=1 Tax=Truncatella angustata TaxID=152316 RepID=A0A9P8UIY8_9PEZI|nr:uncharacterized protein BKA67DRAFT_568428 [Truncatella angustata]KAH6653052.1 hypothetical protein BKA67DRAFT_568428 [Truncatella angustata]